MVDPIGSLRPQARKLGLLIRTKRASRISGPRIFSLVDRDTGRVTPLRHFVAHDVGRAVNPALLRGQLVGAAAQGIAGALYEELPYDADGQPLAISLADYLMPTLAELPRIDIVVIEHEVTTNPLGVKGGGEAGILGATAAVANAVADALGSDSEVVSLPLTPQHVREIIRKQ